MSCIYVRVSPTCGLIKDVHQPAQVRPVPARHVQPENRTKCPGRSFVREKTLLPCKKSFSPRNSSFIPRNSSFYPPQFDIFPPQLSFSPRNFFSPPKVNYFSSVKMDALNILFRSQSRFVLRLGRLPSFRIEHNDREPILLAISSFDGR